MSYQSIKSGSIIETCAVCAHRCPRSSCYNMMVGHTTIFCCTIECKTALNAYYHARNHNKSGFPSDDRFKLSVDHYCYSTKCRASSYNLNVSQIFRLTKYYSLVKHNWCQFSEEKFNSLNEIRIGDEWSREDPFLEEFSDDDITELL